MGGKGELLKNPKYQKKTCTNLIPWPLLSCCPLRRHQCHCTCDCCHCCCCTCCCCCCCCPPPSWSCAWSWCSSLSPSPCFELHPFQPHEQLLAVVVLGAEVVVGLILPLLFPFPRHHPAPCSPPALVFSFVVVVVVVVVVLVVVLVMVMVLVLPSSLVVQLEHPQPPCEQMLTVVGQVLGCCSLILPSLLGLVPSFPH